MLSSNTSDISLDKRMSIGPMLLGFIGGGMLVIFSAFTFYAPTGTGSHIDNNEREMDQATFHF